MKIESNYVDIRNRDIYPAKITVNDGRIVSVKKTNKTSSSYILPGFIDAHIHIESSMLPPSEFARLAVCHGTVATVSDPHEIANVLGIDGVRYMLRNSEGVDFKFHFGASPCVPATQFETSGARLGPEEIEELLSMPQISYLSEVMNFPGVIADDPDMLAKIDIAKKMGLPVDGHAPGLRGDGLSKYIAAGIMTDHEAFKYEEGLEKIKKGMKIIIREGSAAKNFDELSPLIAEYSDKLMFCSDDRHPNDLVREHINGHVRRAIAKGYDLFDVLRIACINPIEHYGLDVGTLRPGESADFIVVKDLNSFENIQTVVNGFVVAENGKSMIKSKTVETPNNFNAGPKKAEDFASEDCIAEEVIKVIDHELFTEEEVLSMSEPHSNILKLSVVNRYEDVKPAVAHIDGFGLIKGAIASSIAHDSHNVISVGTSDELIAKAVNSVIGNRGGICAVDDENIWELPLPIAGLMSDMDGYEVAEKYARIDKIVRKEFGSPLSAPFMTLSFMALLVIPELKLSDKGLFDGKHFKFTHNCRRSM